MTYIYWNAALLFIKPVHVDLNPLSESHLLKPFYNILHNVLILYNPILVSNTECNGIKNLDGWTDRRTDR